MERVQLLLETPDRQALKALADEAHTSMSEVVRDLVRQRMKAVRSARLRQAAERMADAYRTDPELTALTALDADEVLDAPQ